MPGQTNKIFRQEALERLSSPERLDQMMQVVNRKAWLPLTTIGFLIVVAVIWSVFGRIPLTVSGQGVLIRPGNVAQFQVSSEGKILTLNLHPGKIIKQGDVLGTIDQSPLKQQLEQEKSKLKELLNQNKETRDLQNKEFNLQRQNLSQQQAVLNDSLRKNKEFGAMLLEKGFKSIAKRRENIEQSLKIGQASIPTYYERFKQLESLYKREDITEDVFLQAKEQYDDKKTKVSELKAQLQDIGRQEVEEQAQYAKNSNSIKDINTQLQGLNVQLAQLTRQDIEQSLNKSNQVQTTRRNIAQLELQLATKGEITSPYNGSVLAVAAVPGQTISAGSSIASIAIEDPNARLKCLIYLPDKDGKQIKRGMPVQVTPSMVKRERFGGIVGKVTQVSSFPVTNQDISTIIGNPDLANSIAQISGGAPIQIEVQLEQNPKTSDYKWSSSNGPKLNISSGTTAQVRVQVGQQAPISFVIPILRSLTGIY